MYSRNRTRYLRAKARSKKAQTPELQSTANVEYLYPDNPAVYDSIRFKHSSAIVAMSRFPQCLRVNESILFNMIKSHQAPKRLRRHPRPNPTRVDIGNSIDSTSTDDQFRNGTIPQHNCQLSATHIWRHSFNLGTQLKLAVPRYH